MNWTFNDGGRLDAGLHGLVKDCAARAEAILFDVPYLKAIEGTVVAVLDHHYTVVIDNEINDIFDTSDKVVYSYWSKN